MLYLFSKSLAADGVVTFAYYFYFDIEIGMCNRLFVDP